MYAYSCVVCYDMVYITTEVDALAARLPAEGREALEGGDIGAMTQTAN